MRGTARLVTRITLLGTLLGLRMLTELEATPAGVRVVLASETPDYPQRPASSPSLKKNPISRAAFSAIALFTLVLPVT